MSFLGAFDKNLKKHSKIFNYFSKISKHSKKRPQNYRNCRDLAYNDKKTFDFGLIQWKTFKNIQLLIKTFKNIQLLIKNKGQKLVQIDTNTVIFRKCLNIPKIWEIRL